MLTDNTGICDLRILPPETDFVALLGYDAEY